MFQKKKEYLSAFMQKKKSFYLPFASYIYKNPFPAAGKPRNEPMIRLLLMQVVILLKSCDGFPGGCHC